MPRKHSEEELEAAKTLALKLLWRIEDNNAEFAKSNEGRVEKPTESIEDSLNEKFSFKGKTLQVAAGDLHAAFFDEDEHWKFMGKLKELIMKTKAGKEFFDIEDSPEYQQSQEEALKAISGRKHELGKYDKINRKRNKAAPAYVKEHTLAANRLFREYERAFREKLELLCREVEEQHLGIVLEKIRVVRKPERHLSWQNLVHFFRYKKFKAKNREYPFPYIAPETHWEISFRKR